MGKNMSCINIFFYFDKTTKIYKMREKKNSVWEPVCKAYIERKKIKLTDLMYPNKNSNYIAYNSQELGVAIK